MAFAIGALSVVLGAGRGAGLIVSSRKKKSRLPKAKSSSRRQSISDARAGVAPPEKRGRRQSISDATPGVATPENTVLDAIPSTSGGSTSPPTKTYRSLSVGADTTHSAPYNNDFSYKENPLYNESNNISPSASSSVSSPSFIEPVYTGRTWDYYGNTNSPNDYKFMS
jgi:hypothetical protein